MPLKAIDAPAWKLTTAVVVGKEALWIHDCGAVGMFPIGITPQINDACRTCEMRYGSWKPVLVEHTGTTRANTSIEQDEADMDVALRIAPGSTNRHRIYRWRHTEAGVTYTELPAHVDPTDPRSKWVREVAVQGSHQGPWWPAVNGPL